MDVSLVMFKADGTRREFPLSKRQVVLGRKNSCELRIPLNSVSRQHCEITMNNGEVILRDLDSSNGTFHNSIRVKEAKLSPGDEIVIGPVVFTIVINGEPDEIKPVRTIIAGSNGNRHLSKGARQQEGTSIMTSESGDSSVSGNYGPVISLEDSIEAIEAMSGHDDSRGEPASSGNYRLSDEKD